MRIHIDLIKDRLILLQIVLENLNSYSIAVWGLIPCNSALYPNFSIKRLGFY